MPYATSFDNWDPWAAEELPSTFPSELEEVRTRACEILDGRNQQDLINASDSIYRMSSLAFRTAATIEVKRMEAERKRRGSMSDFKFIRYAVETYDLDDFPLFPDARPADYFAVLALAAIGELLILHRDEEERDLVIASDRWTPSGFTVELTNTATAAIDYAARLLAEDRIASQVRSEIKRETARGRWAPYEPIREKYVELAGAYDWSSTSVHAIALEIYDKVNDDWIRDNCEFEVKVPEFDTVYRWLLKHKESLK